MAEQVHTTPDPAQSQGHIVEQDLSQPRTPLEYLRLYFSGFAMGAADIVPGVSGGTMAFILGVYSTLIDSIKSVNLDVIRSALKFDIKAVLEKVPYRFLLALGLGVLSAIFLLASLLHTLLEEQPTFLFAFFAGLIVASILAIGIKVKWNLGAMTALVIAGVFAFLLVGLDRQETPVEAFVAAVDEGGEALEAQTAAIIADLEAADYENAAADVAALQAALEADDKGEIERLEEALDEALYEPSSPLILFISGAIAICAMILPGISGSFILLILGQYAVVLGAVNALDIVSLGAVAAGAALGIMLFSRLISWLLHHHENVTVAALVGFMLGSLRLIWIEAEKGIEVVSDSGTLDGGQVVLVLALIAIGFLLVSFLDHLQSRSNPVFAWFWKGDQSKEPLAQAQGLD